MEIFSRRKRQVNAVSDDEQIARYVHLLDTLPSSVIEKAHAAAFADLSVDQRAEVCGRLRSFLPEGGAADPQPDVLASLVRDAGPREAMMSTAVAGVVASHFVPSAAVVAYFTVGAGSVMIDEQPPWVSELADHDSAPIDGGTVNHRKGVNSGHWFA